MADGSKPAKRGYTFENYTCELINKRKDFKDAVRKALGYKLDKPILARKAVTYEEKRDIDIITDKKIVGCSIKTSEADFSQLERVWLDDLARDLRMPPKITFILSRCLKIKSRNRRERFIQPIYEAPIISYFNSIKKALFIRLFTKNDDGLLLFIVVDFNKKEWIFIKMEEVINLLLKSTILVSSRGVLYFDNVLTMQRKGGDGKHVKLPKSDPRHPGNQIQFKIKPLTLVELLPQNKVFRVRE